MGEHSGQLGRGQVDPGDDVVRPARDSGLGDGRLLALRQQQVRQAATHNRDADAVRAPDRRAALMARLRVLSIEQGVDPEVVARVYPAMVDAFIELELRVHQDQTEQVVDATDESAWRPV